MSRAEARISAAQKAGAADADPVDLSFARGKYQQAQQALSAGKNGPATKLLQESMADSALALTRARLATLRQQISAQRKENERLRRNLLGNAPTSGNGSAPASASSSVMELPQTVLPAPAPPSSASPKPAAAPANGQTQGGGQ